MDSLLTSGMRLHHLGHAAADGKGRLRAGIRRITLFAVTAIAAIALAGGAKAQSGAAELALIQSFGFDPSHVGYVVFDPRSQQTVRAHNATGLSIPASMVKVATAIAALELLGPTYRFRTPVLARETPNGLHVHFSGRGDPLLVQEDIAGLAALLAANVKGASVARFTYDADRLPAIPAIDPTDDLANAYNAPVSALSVNFNRQWLKWSRAEESRALQVEVLPALGHAIGGVAAVEPPDGRPVAVLFDADPAPHSLTRYLLGPRLPSQGARQVAVRQPALRTALMLQRYAAAEGVPMPPPLPAPAPANARELAAHESRPMVEIAAALMEYSNNMSAELVGLAAAGRVWAEVRNLRESAAAVRSWLDKEAPTVTAAGWDVHNQSGLSGASRVSPLALLALLRFASDKVYGETPFLHLLKDRDVGRGRDAVDVFTKSGTMSYARGQAGVIFGPDERPFLFVLMHADLPQRLRFERHPNRLGRDERSRASQWLGRARVLERAMLRLWASTL